MLPSHWNTATDSPHVFGTSVALGDGSALVVGGALDLSLVATNAVHRISEGTGGAGGFGQKDTGFAERFPVPVLMAAADTTPDGDAVFVGGMQLSLTTPAITLSDTIVLFNVE